jgi:hypothetical protein
MPKPAYMIDLDYEEACQYCKEPLLLGEVARDIGQDFKPTTILRKLAKKSGVIGLLIFLKEEEIKNIIESVIGNGITSLPQLSLYQLEAIWRALDAYEKPLLRVTIVSPPEITEIPHIPYQSTAHQFFNFLSEVHTKHEEFCQQAQTAFPLLQMTRGNTDE